MCSILKEVKLSKDESWRPGVFDPASVKSNTNCKLETINVPAILAALQSNPGWKIRFTDEQDGSTLWYVSFQTEKKKGVILKAYIASTSACFINTIKSGLPVKQVYVDVLLSHAGAEVLVFGKYFD
ncbi:hypothetical protein CSUB01_09996 [Colletotrichum sublineola]|uniref:Uncharacterized protein n=1 Tax=Colletotrichum sublineola TaxID=1173701 RepID=A0A066XJJ6_COLSU|nr:hypothetical protein CSUB01_09996 [Colletotrichum sublineola]